MGRIKIAPTLSRVTNGKGPDAWEQFVTVNGKRVRRRLGLVTVMSEAEARSIAAKNRALARGGVDPWELVVERPAEAAASVVAAPSEPALDVQAMIDAAVAAALAAQSRGNGGSAVVVPDSSPTLYEAGMRTWRAKVDSAQLQNVDTVAQWRRRLERYVFPQLGKVRVASIRRRQVVELLESVGENSPYMATQIRAYLREILTDCMAREEIEVNVAGDAVATVVRRLNSARGPVRHYKSIPFEDAPETYNRILNAPKAATNNSYGLCLILLTACRQAEIVGATWDEVDFKRRLWVIPGERMKKGIEHRIPLSGPAVELLLLLRARAMKLDSELVLPTRTGEKMHRNALAHAARRMNAGCSPHGFRTTFRTWVAEKTRYRYEVGETQLAHNVGTAVERAYSRSDYLEERRELMDKWAAFLTNAVQ